MMAITTKSSTSVKPLQKRAVVLAFFFNTTLLALTINIASGLL